MNKIFKEASKGVVVCVYVYICINRTSINPFVVNQHLQF